MTGTNPVKTSFGEPERPLDGFEKKIDDGRQRDLVIRYGQARETVMIEDAQGHRLSGATEAAVTAYDKAVRAFNLVHGDSIGLFEEARQVAPDFAMAHLGKAWVFAVANDPVLMTQAKTLVETARPLTLNEREEAHLAALSHLVQGGRAAAVAVLDRHLMRYPFDLVAHQGAALTDGFLGRFHRVRDRSARALPLWSKDQPGLWIPAGLPRLRAGGSGRLRPRRG
jgi:hypothetical protein